MLKLAGWSLMLFAAVHFVVTGPDLAAGLPLWLKGALWSTDGLNPIATQSTAMVRLAATFWSTVGSAAIPLALIGGWVVAREREGGAPPLWLAAALVVYMAAGTLVMEPSGFPLGLVIALILLRGTLAHGRRRQHARQRDRQ